jgi:D-galacturonate reductase
MPLSFLLPIVSVLCTRDKLAVRRALILEDTHYAIARYAIEHGLHVLVTKPATQLLSHHLELIELSRKHNVVCFVEHHKRSAPFSLSITLCPWLSCISQVRPCLQRCTSTCEGTWRVQFLQRVDEPAKGPVGDLPSLGRQRLRHQVTWWSCGHEACFHHKNGSYYLSSHHIDICCWILQDKAFPTRVVASAASGIATSEPYNCVPGTEDTITLLVDWQSVKSPKHKGAAVYTASWTAPLKSGVHSAQHWYYLGERVSLIPLSKLRTNNNCCLGGH